MGSHGIKDQVAIVGMGCTEFAEHWDKGADDLIIWAANEAFEAAGLDKEAIDAYWYGTAMSGSSGLGIARPLHLHNKPVTRVENMCATGGEALRGAAYAVASGAYDVAMAIGVEKLKDTGYPGLGPGRGMSPVYEARRTAPGSFGLIATRYFEKYGLSLEEGKETIGKIAVKNHRNGSMSPKAHFHNVVTLEQVVKAPIIAFPLGLFDCCGNSDGSACAILTRADMAKDFRGDPVFCKGFGISIDALIPHSRPGFEWTSFEALKTSSRKAYDMAGIRNPREDIDVAEVHDCFTITELAIYEDFGFSPRG